MPHVCRTCRYLNDLANSDQIWKKFCNIYININNVEHQPTQKISWKKHYQLNAPKWQRLQNSMGFYLIELEKGIKWEGVDEQIWRPRRETWLADCDNITFTPGSAPVNKVVRLMKELQAVILPKSYSPDFLKVREDWEKRADKVDRFLDAAKLLIEFQNRLVDSCYSNHFLTSKEWWTREVMDQITL